MGVGNFIGSINCFIGSIAYFLVAMSLLPVVMKVGMELPGPGTILGMANDRNQKSNTRVFIKSNSCVISMQIDILHKKLTKHNLIFWKSGTIIAL